MFVPCFAAIRHCNLYSRNVATSTKQIMTTMGGVDASLRCLRTRKLSVCVFQAFLAASFEAHGR